MKPTPAQIRAVMAHIGKKGGKRRAAKLTPEQRAAIASMGGKAKAAKAPPAGER